MISAVKWIPQGVSLEWPLRVKVEDTDAENRQGADRSGALDDKSACRNVNEDYQDRQIIDKFSLDDYEDDPTTGFLGLPPGVFEEYDASNDIEEMDSSEMEELRIDQSDNLILIAKISEEVSSVEVYVRGKEGDMYIHHDIILSDTPLCIEWLRSSDIPSMASQQHSSRSHVAIGTFSSHIEIWNIDTIDSLYPDLVLGYSKKPKSGAKRHSGAVTCLSQNKIQQSVIASGSSDKTVKLWDIVHSKYAISSFTNHSSSIQAVCWNLFEPTVLLSGGQDKKIAVMDVRAKEAVLEFKTTSDVECLACDPFNRWNLFASMENGVVCSYDFRNTKKPSITLDAHDGAVSTINVCSSMNQIVVTSSVDRLIKVWNFSNNTPTCVLTKMPGIGMIFSSEFCPESEMSLLAGGSSGKFVVWELESLIEHGDSSPDTCGGGD